MDTSPIYTKLLEELVRDGWRKRSEVAEGSSLANPDGDSDATSPIPVVYANDDGQVADG